MSNIKSILPKKPKIETDRLPITWLHYMALNEGNAKRPIYRIHKWWARRLSSIFRMLLLLAVTPSTRRVDHLISDYYSRHDMSHLVLLDPFMGGGTSIIESTKVNARTIGVDIDPVAWFVTKKEIEQFSEDEIQKVFAGLKETVGKKILSLYQTKTPDGKLVPIIYSFWVDLITCPNCRLSLRPIRTIK